MAKIVNETTKKSKIISLSLKISMRGNIYIYIYIYITTIFLSLWSAKYLQSWKRVGQNYKIVKNVSLCLL